jgi:hypothetical protein
MTRTHKSVRKQKLENEFQAANKHTGRRNKSNIFPRLPWRGCTFSPNNKNPRLLRHQTQYHHFQCSLTKQQKQEGRKQTNKSLQYLYTQEKKHKKLNQNHTTKYY